MDKLNEEIARKKREREEARAGNTLKTDGKYVKMGITSKTVAAAAALSESKVSLQSSDRSSALAVEAKPVAIAQVSKSNSGTATKTRRRKVLVSADRVTFTVQRDVAVTSSADDAENPHLRMLMEWRKKTQASEYDGPEAEWLMEFTQYVEDYDRKLGRRPFQFTTSGETAIPGESSAVAAKASGGGFRTSIRKRADDGYPTTDDEAAGGDVDETLLVRKKPKEEAPKLTPEMEAECQRLQDLKERDEFARRLIDKDKEKDRKSRVVPHLSLSEQLDEKQRTRIARSDEERKLLLDESRLVSRQSYLSDEERKRLLDESRIREQTKLRKTLPAVQAFYHSSALPLPSTDGDNLGDVSNGLISACLMAFTGHKRLVLRPDDIFFPLLNAAATHVFQNGEASRDVFVRHTGKKDLIVHRDNFAPPDSAPNVNDWAGTLPEFRAKLHQNVRAGSVDAALPNFSTSDAITSAAFTCTLMRALQNFFTYSCNTLCGIPEVTLLGTVADWTDLHARFIVLAETWMQRTPATCDWARTVDTFLKQFIAARKGRVDDEWWISLFTYRGSKGSGSSPYVTGHINALFPWAEPTVSYGSKTAAQGMVWVGLQSAKKSFPGGMNTVPMTWNYLGQQIAMTAWSGSMCACESEDGREVAPAVCVGFTVDSASDGPH